MVFSRATEYALKSLVYMTRNSEKEYFGVRELAHHLQISTSYLAKILQSLARAGVLNSTTGPGGGFGLSDAGREFNLMKLMEILEEHAFLDKCVLGWAECGEANPCPFHFIWGKYRSDLIEYLKKHKISDLLHSPWPQEMLLSPKKRSLSGKKRQSE